MNRQLRNAESTPDGKTRPADQGPSRTACVFAHYDMQDKVDEYVLYYLRELQKIAATIHFVTTSALNDAERGKVASLGVNVLQRNNDGYDFCSYKLGIESIDRSQIDELIVCNDSVYGPFAELDELFATMRLRGANFWGLTDSYDYQHHLQSYFLVFSGDALQSQAFKGFWNSVEALSDKRDIIRRYEVGLSQSMAAAGFPPEALARSGKVGNAKHVGSYWRYYFSMLLRRWREKRFWSDSLRVMTGKLKVGKNVTHLEWKSLIEDGGVPFVKVGLMRDNPKHVADLDEVYDVIQHAGGYPVHYIQDHLRRTGRASSP